MRKPWEIIQELEADNSRLKKESIIKRESDADNIRFFDGVCMALDGFRTFGVQQVPVAKKDGPGITQSQFNDIVGRLDVLFASYGELLSLSHNATERNILARGALKAVLWARDKQPGQYDMMDVLGLN